MSQLPVQLGWADGQPMKIWGEVKQVTTSWCIKDPIHSFRPLVPSTVTLEASCTKWCRFKMEVRQLIYLSFCEAAIILKRLKFQG